MSSDFSKDSRQSPWAILLLWGKFSWIALRSSWIVLVMLALRPSREGFLLLAAIVGGVTLVALLWTVIVYLSFRFRLEGDHLLVRKGWLMRSAKTIPVERIQGIHLEQNPVHRATGTVRVKIETAGTAAEEVTIDALEVHRSESLRAALFAGRGVTDAAEGEQPVEASPDGPPLFTLGALDLLKAGLGQNPLRLVGVTVGVLIGFMDDLQQMFGVSKAQVEMAEQALHSVAVLAGLFVVIGVGAVIAGTSQVMLRYADLALWADERRFRIHAGLITLRETVVGGRKLQSLTWSQNPLQRLFGMFRLEFRQAVPGKIQADSHVLVPGLSGERLRMVADRAFPEDSREGGGWRGIDPRYRIYHWVLSGWIPFSVVLALLLWKLPELAPAALLWLPWTWWAAGRYARALRWYLNADLLVLHRGWLTREVTLMPAAKVQRVTLEAGPLERRFGLRTVELHTAAGTESVPWLPEADAERLRDWILYRTESDPRPWM